ncbi:MAG: alanine racemase [Clostridia bacterium]|nr:alanine racemase [Clostridia bacterium]
MNVYHENDLLSSAKTPFYCFDLDAVRNHVRACKEILSPSVHLCYSIKANPFLVPVMDDEIGMLEVCSPGELEICHANHLHMSHILYSGVNKTLEDIERALMYGVHTFTCESRLHADLLENFAAQLPFPLDVFLRLTAGSQFGMDESEFMDILRSPDKYSHLNIQGIHYFSGTQRKKLSDQRSELAFLSDLLARLKQEGIVLPKVEYGTGLYFPYFVNEDHSDILAPLRELAPDLARLSEQADVTIEMGRFLASGCGTFYTTVQDTKINKGQGYAILDGGIHHLNYYGGSMGMRQPLITRIPRAPLPEDTEDRDWMLCGSLCTTADILVRKYPAKGLRIGDILAFHNCGAYSVTEAPALFLSRTLPAVLLKEEDRYTEVRPHLPSWKLNTEGLYMI